MFLVFFLCLSGVAVPAESAGDAATPLTATEIVEKTVAARGGEKAWQQVQTMAWVGHVESGGSAARILPFLLEFKRPNKTRFEISALSQKSVRIYDGKDGWKVKPAANGKPILENYSAEELKFARDGQIIDGPVMDFIHKGLPITLEGEEELDGHKTYRLAVRQTSGLTQHVWVDGETFLELKYDRAARSGPAMPRLVPIYLRNYQNFEGLQMPTVIETGPAMGGTENAATDKMVIEKIALNPPLEDDLFAKPRLPGQHNKIIVDTRTPPPTPRPPPAASGAGNAQ
jgi:outer membrane lipoprotein-sorting protein